MLSPCLHSGMLESSFFVIPNQISTTGQNPGSVWISEFKRERRKRQREMAIANFIFRNVSRSDDSNLEPPTYQLRKPMMIHYANTTPATLFVKCTFMLLISVICFPRKINKVENFPKKLKLANGKKFRKKIKIQKKWVL